MCALVTGVQTCALPIYQVGPVFPNQIDFDPAPGNLIELSVARLAVDAPQLRAADVRQTGAESVAQEPEQAENCVGIGSGVGHNLQRIELGFLLQQESQDDQTVAQGAGDDRRSEEHTSELQSLLRNSYAVFCLQKQ